MGNLLAQLSDYGAALWNGWLWWVGGMLTVNEIVGWLVPKWPLDDWVRKHRWRVALALLTCAQFGAYQELGSKRQDDLRVANDKTGALEGQLKSLNDRFQKLQGASEQKDKQIAEMTSAASSLRDRLADARDAKSSRPIEVKLPASGAASQPPQVEGISWSIRQVPSPEESAPHALEITIQSRASVAPFSIGIVADKALVGGKLNIIGPSMFDMADGRIRGEEASRSFLAKSGTGITPATPWQITVWSKEPFKITRIFRAS